MADPFSESEEQLARGVAGAVRALLLVLYLRTGDRERARVDTRDLVMRALDHVLGPK